MSLGYGLPLQRSLRRGTARLLVLKVLSEKPMHGYEVGKRISFLFGSTYEPSPGVIYPTLQSLQDEGYVKGARNGGTVVYTVTGAGGAYLAGNRERLEEALKLAKRVADGSEFPVLRSAARLERALRVYAPEMSAGEKAEVSRILDDAVKRIMKVVDSG